jgi:hypothetical protein
MKLPFLQFFTGDWLKDPTVSMLSPAARGIYLDLICVMAEHDRSGQITSNRPALARLTRCSTDELASALNEWTLCGTVEVISDDANGLVTVTNRRMAREHKEREMAAKRQQRAREAERQPETVTVNVTPPSRPILQSTEVRDQREKEVYSKPLTEGVEGGDVENSKLQTPNPKALRGRAADVEALCKVVLNGQWEADGNKWITRIRDNAEKVWRVFTDVKNAAAEKRIKTTPGQMAEYNWKVFK